MHSYSNVEIGPEEETSNAHAAEEARRINKKNAVHLFELIAYIYVALIVLYLLARPYDFGQTTPAKINWSYILPCTFLFSIFLSIMGAYPFFMLKRNDIHVDVYPDFIKGGASYSAYSNFAASICVMPHIYAILGPIYYVFDYYIYTDVGVFQTVVASIYLVAFLLSSRVWVLSMRSLFNCIINTIKIWKFANERAMEHNQILI